MIEDLDSKNGTFVNGIRLHQGEQRLMLAGIEVDLAHVRLVFDGHSEAAADAEGTATIAAGSSATCSSGRPAPAPRR
jgi:pSer/pThr/pTyr-binding forkhead associated (FHA) protein